MESWPSELVLLRLIIPTCLFFEAKSTKPTLLQSFFLKINVYNVGDICLQSFAELLFTILFDKGSKAELNFEAILGFYRQTV